MHEIHSWNPIDSLMLLAIGILVFLFAYLFSRVVEGLSVIGIKANPNIRTVIVFMGVAVLGLGIARIMMGYRHHHHHHHREPRILVS